MNREPESRTTRESSGIDPKSPEDLLSRQDLTREEKVEMLAG